jgi:hypothetical protein
MMPHDFNTLTDEQWEDWYRPTPQQRWAESEKLWELYLSLGGSLDAEPDPQSPFDADIPHGESTCLWAARRAYYTARPSLM